MDPTDPVGRLLLEVLDRPESLWEAGVAELSAREPAHAAELRRRFDMLRSSGFVGAEPVDAPEPAIPERLGEFQLLERLGQGGMGVVYAARQARLGRTVALKLVRPEQLYFAGARERFQREITAVAKLSHPGIVAVFNVGDEHGIPYFAMELLRGASLDEVLRALAGRRVESLTGADLRAVVARHAGGAVHGELFSGSWADVCAGIARRVAEALAHAHQNGVVHRDIKPSNVIVTTEGRVVLLDFGLARPAGVDRMTRHGSHVGSLPYMAPEQLRGEEGDARTDVYGLGVLLRELLTLRQPFLSPSSETTRQRILHGDGAPIGPGNRSVSWELAAVCSVATDPEPRRRYATAAEFARDLENVLQHEPILARPAGALRRTWRWAQRRPALATGLFVGLLAAIGTPTAIAIGIAEQRDRARAAEAQQQRRTYEANLAAANAALQSHDAAEARRRLAACPTGLRGFEWHHLALTLDGSLLTLEGHATSVTAAALTPDASLLASGGQDGEVRLWDLARGALLQSLGNHHAEIAQLEFSSDGRRLLVNDLDGNTSVIDVATRKLLAERPRASAQEHVSIGVDADCVLASQGGWRLLELDPLTLATRREIALEQAGPPSEELSVHDSTRLCAVTSSDVLVWDLATGRELQRVTNVSNEGIVALSMNAGGDRLAISNTEGRIVIVRLADGTVLQVLSDGGGAGKLAFDRTGELLAKVGGDGVVRVWAVATGRQLAALVGHEGPIQAVASGGARMLIASAGRDRTLRLWSPFGSRDHQLLLGHVGVVTRLSLLPAGERLVSVSQDGSLRAWDVSTGMPLATRTDYLSHVNALAVSADGHTAWAAYHNVVLTTNLDDMSSAHTWTLPTARILDLATAPTGDRILVATAEGCVLLDKLGRRSADELRGQHGAARSCAFGERGEVAFGGGEDGRLLRWDLRAGGAGRTLFEGRDPILSLGVSHDGRSVYAATGPLLQRRDAQAGTLVWEGTSSSPPLALAELADGTRVVTGHNDGSVVFWDAQTGTPVLIRRISEQPITALSCDPNGDFVVAGAADGNCHILRATAPVEQADLLRFAGTSAAMQLHAALRQGLRTRDDVLAAIDARTDLDPDLRRWMRDCERCWLRMPWRTVRAAHDVVLDPGRPAERYFAARRVAEEYLLAIGSKNYIAIATIALASARLGDPDRALSAAAELHGELLADDNPYLPSLLAGRALALQASGQAPAARADLEHLAALAAARGAGTDVIALWREVETALAH